MRKLLKRIRRCQHCGTKTHQRFWENGSCPVCELSLGYSLSDHGGLVAREIKEYKKALLVAQKR